MGRHPFEIKIIHWVFPRSALRCNCWLQRQTLPWRSVSFFHAAISCKTRKIGVCSPSLKTWAAPHVGHQPVHGNFLRFASWPWIMKCTAVRITHVTVGRPSSCIQTAVLLA